MALISTALSAIVVVLNSIGLEMYTKLCYKSMLPTSDNLITEKNNTAPADTSNAPLHWVGECGTFLIRIWSLYKEMLNDLSSNCTGESSFILMGIVVFLHVLLFLTSASCSSYICRALNSSYSVRVSPTQVVFWIKVSRFRS